MHLHTPAAAGAQYTGDRGNCPKLAVCQPVCQSGARAADKAPICHKMGPAHAHAHPVAGVSCYLWQGTRPLHLLTVNRHTRHLSGIPSSRPSQQAPPCSHTQSHRNLALRVPLLQLLGTCRTPPHPSFTQPSRYNQQLGISLMHASAIVHQEHIYSTTDTASTHHRRGLWAHPERPPVPCNLARGAARCLVQHQGSCAPVVHLPHNPHSRQC
jgi:hypothetical protein